MSIDRMIRYRLIEWYEISIDEVSIDSLQVHEANLNPQQDYLYLDTSTHTHSHKRELAKRTCIATPTPQQRHQATDGRVWIPAS